MCRRMGPPAWRTALVTSSLTMSSVVSVSFSSPHRASCRTARERAVPAEDASAGSSHEAVSSGPSERVRARRSVTSSEGLVAGRVSIRTRDSSSRVAPGRARWALRRSMPSSMSCRRSSMRPSLNRAITLPSGSSSSVLSYGSVARPSGVPAGTSGRITLPSGWRIAGGG